ncbi:hypothetical protein [Ensifer sp. LBL]|uniref:hypothetical protein n=1 Tax=Ensifer sp. LBL TaxID=2991056 RepID=UPI003D217C48
MFRKLALAFVVAAGSSDAIASETGTFTDLFESVCIGSQLKPDLVSTILTQAASFYGMQLKELPQEHVVTLAAGAQRGWGIAKDASEAFVVVVGQRTMDNGKLSNNCAITKQGVGGADEVKSFVERKFKSKKILEQAQGSSDVAVYGVELLGFDKKAAIGIQSTQGSDPNLSMLMLSLFEAE